MGININKSIANIAINSLSKYREEKPLNATINHNIVSPMLATSKETDKKFFDLSDFIFLLLFHGKLNNFI